MDIKREKLKFDNSYGLVCTVRTDTDTESTSTCVRKLTFQLLFHTSTSIEYCVRNSTDVPHHTDTIEKNFTHKNADFNLLIKHILNVMLITLIT